MNSPFDGQVADCSYDVDHIGMIFKLGIPPPSDCSTASLAPPSRRAEGARMAHACIGVVAGEAERGASDEQW